MIRLSFIILFFLSSQAFAMTQNTKLESRILDIALHEYDQSSSDWNVSQRDCAGLVRYIYRKALGVQKNLWRDNQGGSVSFASAEHLVHSNFRFLSREIHESEIRSGDLLVYYSDEKETANRYHLMVLLKSPQAALQKILVVYHNGAEKPKGQIKRIWLSDLGKLAGPEWIPQFQNSHFQGVYRWRQW